ncbi:hypothetical protein [Caulobacter sp. S45]|uniref:hypothetical protein n=1 Tax=Caulobacter sp. S45 TaxID=1641861 RepID=UPI00131C2C29|nr:hypothetical protein [Caulobacter sp. S45]
MKFPVRAFGLTLGIFASSGACLAQVANKPPAGQISERPWIDVTLIPSDLNQMKSAKVTASSISGFNRKFILVRRDPAQLGGVTFSQIGEDKIVALTGSAEIQLGNETLVKTYKVDGGVSICVAASTVIGCQSLAGSQMVKTAPANDPPTGGVGRPSS